jgi:membrane protein DedA with SNARE-associated domain/rhodanese-related sulfurtransferase
MQHIVHLLVEYGLLAVFLNVLFDDGGLPLPAQPLLIVAGALVADGKLHLPTLWAAAVAGAFVADNGWYWIARRYGRRVLSILCRVSLSPDSCVRKTESLFSRVGPASLLIAKFVPGLGNVTVALCGVTRVGIWLFLPLELGAAMLHTGAAIFLGLLFHDAAAAVINTLGALGEYGLVLIGLALVVYLSYRWWERRAFIRQLQMDRISVDELAAMLEGDGVRPLILDVRQSSVRARDGIIPGAISAHADELNPELAQFPRDAEIVVYCSCPNEASAALAAMHLKRAGFRHIRPLLGGVEAWIKAGHPITHMPMQQVA